MDKTFPMLTEHSSAYPYARNVDVDSTVPTYDYARWTAGARIRLYSVQWTGDDVVDFGSEIARDAWFNDHAAVAVTLETSANISVDGTIKLPIPFTTLRRFNYCAVDYPDFPVDRTDTPIPLYAYWIRDVRSAAPSTSIADVRLDEWQTYRYRLTFTRCALDRGHLAVNKAPDVETFLANPLDNSDWVRIPEAVAPVTGPRQITARKIYDIWGGEKYVVLGSTAPLKAWRAEIPTPDTLDAGAAPTYADTADRYGHQYDVTAGFNPAGQDWTAAPGANSITTVSQDGRAPALTAIAFKASDVYGANEVLDKLQTAAPWLYESVRAAIIVPESFISLGTSYDFLGVKAYEVRPAQNPLATLHFAKHDFDYPPECEGWTKLYAFPWALAEVSDDMGHTVEVRIEDCTGATTLNTRCVALFPYVKASAFVLGYEQRGLQHSYTYLFKQLDGGEARSFFYATNPSEHAFELDIPTFALWRNSSATKSYDAGADWERTGRHALADYRTAMRGANTGLENTKDITATRLANAKASNALALSNATRSADTGQTNANASADTGLSNAKASNMVALGNATRSADTGLTSAKASADTARTNIDTQTDAAKKTTDRTNSNSTANTKIANDTALYVTSRNNILNTKQTGDPADAPEGKTPEGSNFWKLNQDYVTDNNKMTSDWTAANTAAIESIVPSTVSNAVSGTTGVAGSLNGTSQITGAHSSIPQVGETMGIAAGGAAAMAIGAAAAGVIGASLQYGVTLAKNKELIDNNRTQMSEKKDHAQKNMIYMNAQNREAATDVTNQQIKAAQGMTANSVQAASDINGYSVTAAKTIGDANKTTAYANAKRARDTAVDNATDTKANADSVAIATNTTTKANAKRARDTAVDNATDTKANADNVATATNATAKANAKRARDTAVDNATDTKANADNVATATNTTTKANAKRARDTAVDNATDTKANADNVATASAATTNANATYSRDDVSEFAAKTALENARLDLIADYVTASRTQPTAQGTDSGNVDMLEWGGAVHVRVRTQPVAELENAASEFALTGYNAEGRIVDTANTLQVRRHFSFWRGRMWVAPAPGVPFQAIDAIRSKFFDGVTVWSKPEEIGAVDPFAN